MTLPRGDDERQRQRDRHADGFRQRGRRGARAAFAAIDMHIIGTSFGMIDAIGKPFVEKLIVAHDKFHAHRQLRDAAHARNEFAQFTDASNVMMPIRADRSLACGDAANGRDFARHFRSGQQATLAGLCALPELDLNHPHAFMRCDCAQLFLAQIAMLVAHAVFCRADLEDDVGAALNVKG